MKNRKFFSTPLFLLLLLECSIVTPTGLIEGTIVDATTGDGLGDVSISVENHTGYSAKSKSDGSFVLSAPAGTQVLLFNLEGYDFLPVTVSVTEGESTYIPEASIFANPVLPEGDIRIVLTWGCEPEDLDLHLLTPGNDHVFFEDEAPEGAGARLEVDDSTGYGPETITITERLPGAYTFFVYNFSGYPEITSSKAVVRVFYIDGLLKTYNIPTEGEGRYWEIADLDGLELTDINNITDSIPISSFP
jgi:hypothetical protein